MARCGTGRPAEDPAGAGRADANGSEFAADAAGYEHNHVHEQISYCVTGRFEYSLDRRTHVLTDSGSIYVPSNGRHGAKALGPGTLIEVFTPVRDDLFERR
jgi:quercetin dioxygenase-like cupin family protein